LKRTAVAALLAAHFVLAALLAACTNNPYPVSDDAAKVLYLPFDDPPKTLDPQVAYSTIDHAVIGNLYDTLLEYHYLKRPLELIPGLAEDVPSPRAEADGRVAYTFRIRHGLRFHDDPCFALGGEGRSTREVTASDVAFALARVGDPLVNSPVLETLEKIVGLKQFGERLAERRGADPAFAALRIDAQYEAAAPIEGVRVRGPHELEIVLGEPYPQIVYWFAMPFTAPVPWEAVAAYDGREGRPSFAEHPVGTGPFRLARYDKRARIVLEANPTWYGVLHPEWQAPGAVYPAQGEPEDAARGLLDGRYAGRPLPFLERIEMRRDKEDIPAFSKFLQGYYDASGIIQESFDRIVHEGELSEEMRAADMKLVKGVTPAVYYLGFNMDDPLVGAAGGERARKLRQAMSLAIDAKEYARLFMNGRGIPAQSPIPPGIFGYDAAYANPYRRVDLERARALLREAGYADGVDAQSGKPLHLSFDTPDTSARAMLRFQFFANAWKRIGIDVEIAATSYNQFQDKVRRGAFQLFMWGWVADYPDPENFLFLLWTQMGRTKSGGPNTANFSHPGYDALFLEMKNRPNDARREDLIRELRAIVERERPWIELFHPEDYALYHGWLANVKPMGLSVPTSKYRDIDAPARARLRAERNRPVRWPAALLVAAFVAVLVPTVRTYLRERQ
jgi:ABC-type transport system substrate-binding protein